MNREHFRVPFSKLCRMDIDEMWVELESAASILDAENEPSESCAVRDLMKLATDMIEYLEKENH